MDSPSAIGMIVATIGPLAHFSFSLTITRVDDLIKFHHIPFNLKKILFGEVFPKSFELLLIPKSSSVLGLAPALVSGDIAAVVYCVRPTGVIVDIDKIAGRLVPPTAHDILSEQFPLLLYT